jgi:hypothetical protein
MLISASQFVTTLVRSDVNPISGQLIYDGPAPSGVQGCRPMELLVFYPSDTRPKKRHFDGPVSLGVQQAVGEDPELVPGFTSILHEGVIYPCIAYCDREAKRNGSAMNAWASALWHAALKREGYERGLRHEDGTVADWLNGSVVVVCTGEPLAPK